MKQEILAQQCCCNQLIGTLMSRIDEFFSDANGKIKNNDRERQLSDENESDNEKRNPW